MPPVGELGFPLTKAKQAHFPKDVKNVKSVRRVGTPGGRTRRMTKIVTGSGIGIEVQFAGSVVLDSRKLLKSTARPSFSAKRGISVF
jgi:hypothetical protein